MERIMKIDTSIPVPEPHPSATRYSGLTDTLRMMTNGDSVWVATVNERSTVRKLFWKLQRRGETDLIMISRQVYEDDPNGPGYRLWTVSKRP